MAEIEECIRGFMWHKSTVYVEGKILSDDGKTCDVVCDIMLDG